MKALTVIACAVLAVAAGCSANKDNTKNPATCFTNDDCKSDSSACFLGSCVEAGAGLGKVEIDVQPMQGSSALRQRLSRDFDGSSGPQDLTLAPTLHIQGAVVGFGASVNGTVRIDLVGNDSCPALIDTTASASTDDTQSYQTDIADAGFELEAVPGRYRVVMTPNAAHALPPVVLPSDGSCGMDIEDGTILTIPYPAQLLNIQGRLRYSNDDATGVAGARIIVMGTSATGGSLVSAPVETGADGSFTVSFPAGGTQLTALVRPGSNTGVPTESFAVTPDGNGNVGDLILNVSAAVNVQITVTDGSGTPSPDTTVTATGIVGDSNQGSVTISGATGANGQVMLSLRAGAYNIVAMPRVTAGNGLAETHLTVMKDPLPAPITLVLPAKATVTGVVHNATGAPVTNAHVTYKLRDISTDREVTATTTSDGSYTIAVDTVSPLGDPSGAEYEVVVEPSSDSKDPHHRELVRVSGSTEIDVTLFSPAFVYGTVYDADGNIVPEAALLFYSRLSSNTPLLVGVAQTTAVGEFAVPLPQP